MSIDTSGVSIKDYDFIIHNTESPFEIVAFKEVGKDLVVLDKKVAMSILDRRLIKINEDLQKAINIQMEILRSNG